MQISALSLFLKVKGQPDRKMKNANINIAISTLLLFMLNVACSKSGDSPSDNNNPIKKGILYYSAANELIRYDFQSKQELKLFSDGDHYRISQDAKRFIWYKNDFTNGTTLVQVHNLPNPDEYEPITVSYILDQTPRFIPGSDHQYVALARADDGAVNRQDLVVFSSDNSSATGHIPHVKAFVILPNGNDLVISAEALNASGASIGFALAVVRNFRSASGQKSFTIHEYPDYTQLPVDISISPDGRELVFTHLDHLYTVNVEQGALPKQITQSRFGEADAAWSKNGKYIVFTANTSGPSDDCGEVRIIPAHPKNPITIPEDGVNNEPVDDLQPVDINGNTINACGSESYLWF